MPRAGGTMLCLGAMCLSLLLRSPVRATHESVDVTLTYYSLRGVTYSGGQTGPGVAACSYNFAMGTRLRLPDGTVVRCEDRGGGLGARHVDVWVASYEEAIRRGRYTATVTIVHPEE